MSMETEKINRLEVFRIRELLSPILSKFTPKWELCGSWRRGKSEIGDLDFVTTQIDMPAFKAALETLSALHILEIWRSGALVMSMFVKPEDKAVQIEFLNVSSNNFGSGLLHATGSADFSKEFRTYCKQKGFSLSQNGLVKAATKEWVAGNTEADIFSVMNLGFIPPEARNAGFWKIKDQYKLAK